MKKVLTFATCAMVLALAATAYADTLHGFCVSPTAPCSDNGTITPMGVNPPHFSFSYSGSHAANSKLWLIGLVPDNENSGFSLTLAGTNTADPSATASLFSSTEWNSGKLSDYMTNPSFPTFPKPAHPLDAYQSGATSVGLTPPNGYFVYLFNFGLFDYNTAPPDPEFSVSSGTVPQGMLFLGVQTNAKNKVLVDTPNSATLIEGQSMPTPEPGSLLLLGSGAIGLAGVLRRKLVK